VTANTITVGGVTATHLVVNIDNSGNMVVSFAVPNGAATRAAGTKKVRVSDGTRVGEADLITPSRAITLSPTSSKRGSTVTVTGTGFPSEDTSSFTYAAVATPIGSVTSNTAGGFTHTFTVPTTAGIPSTNTVTANPALTDVADATATHSVPGATITLDPATASPGSTVTVSGTGFPGFAALTTLNVGSVGAIPSPAPSTDSDGNLTAKVLVPQITLGTQAVTVTVGGAGGTTATSSLTIVAAPVVPVVTTTATGTVFASVIAQADNLVRVWRYSNATQAWAFYDPRTAFAAANTLTTTSSADIVWVNVKAQQTFQGKTLFAGWNLISLN
jgi:hypothetical protein